MIFICTVQDRSHNVAKIFLYLYEIHSIVVENFNFPLLKGGYTQNELVAFVRSFVRPFAHYSHSFFSIIYIYIYIYILQGVTEGLSRSRNPNLMLVFVNCINEKLDSSGNAISTRKS